MHIYDCESRSVLTIMQNFKVFLMHINANSLPVCFFFYCRLGVILINMIYFIINKKGMVHTFFQCVWQKTIMNFVPPTPFLVLEK